MSGGAFIKSQAECPGNRMGFEDDVERCCAMVRSIIEMVRCDSETDIEEMKGTIETILEMVEEGLESIRENYEKGIYDQPTKEPTEEELKA